MNNSENTRIVTSTPDNPEDNIDVERRKFVGNAIAAIVAITGATALSELPKLFAWGSKETSANIENEYKEIVSILNNIDMNYTYGSTNLEGRIADMEIFVCNGKTYFKDYYTYGKMINSGNCCELSVADGKKLYDTFVEQGIQNKYTIEIVNGTEPRFFHNRLLHQKGGKGGLTRIGGISHFFLRIISKETGEIFYRDPSFNMPVESAKNSKYTVKSKLANIPGIKEAYETMHDAKSDTYTALGLTDDNKMIFITGWDDGAYNMAIMSQKEIEYFRLSEKTLSKIKSALWQNICSDLMKFPPKEVQCDKIPREYIGIDFNANWKQ